ncbi:MAG TPA: FeoB small GTPase domain-containing protein, partial [Oscillospiraceae bacterium]|nr:FeoB small GTPase domain-containing protein [Oscillospiraceae bacterium]
MRIALIGNPNCGKTTLFNELTGSSQSVGNWPGVTVEKKVGRLKKDAGTEIIDLPGVYSLSPYTMEEAVTRDYLIGERPDAVVDILDGTNLERNLYLTLQVMELRLPLVLAVNMMDEVKSRGDTLDCRTLGELLGVPVAPIVARKGEGLPELVKLAEGLARGRLRNSVHLRYDDNTEHALSRIL